ncbi:GAS2-like protein 2 [Anolis sagrei]|uniref:GAS2-like protein 2 n=1 Tax=Anolis sagrei TaxID=38937 RepID=UPI003521E5B8
MKSVRRYGSREAYLEAMEEDLAEWLRELHGAHLGTGPAFLGPLETGVLLCHHANQATKEAALFSQEQPKVASKALLPARGTSCNHEARPGTFQARDNVANFIQWCRQEMHIPEVLMFETEDLVLRKNERQVVLCLLEVARRGARFGMKAPALVRMEQEIEEEMRLDLGPAPTEEENPFPKAQREPQHFRNLDQMVQHLISRCTCPVQFSMVKVSEGKYRVGDSSTLIFVRILRKHVMVRVGGGWDTLEHYLDKHDPCRCTSLSHKQALRMSSPQRTLATPVQHEITARLTPRTDNKPHVPQPTALIVSRSQSPLPPVEWRTYVSPGLGSGWKVASGPSVDNIGLDDRKKMTSRSISQDHIGPRRASSSDRIREQSTTPPGRWTTAEERPSLEQHGRSGTFHAFSQMDRHPMKDLPISRWGSGSLQTDLDPQREMAKKPATRAATPQTSRHKERDSCPLTRPSSPTKPLRASNTQERVPTLNSQRKDSITQRSTSPVKTPVPKMEALATGKVSRTNYRPPTPSKSLPCCRNGTQGPNNKKEEGKTNLVEVSGWRAETGMDVMDLDRNRRSGQRVPQRLQRGVQKSYGSIIEKRCVNTPLPVNLEDECSLYQSLEEEIMANVKELEDNLEGNDVKTGEALGPDGFSLEHKQVCVNGERVPRSGVYVPERGAKWPLVGGCYEDVIRELSVALNHEQVKTGRPLKERKSPNIEESLAPKDTESKEVGIKEAKLNGSASMFTNPIASEEAALIPEKPKRSLKKPKRVPSIYKLKLRPQIRPRKDHRPEKRPSKIPRPVGHHYRQQTGQQKTLGPKTLSQGDRWEKNCLGNIKKDGEMGLLKSKETWV